jgi:hypothetical protein
MPRIGLTNRDAIISFSNAEMKIIRYSNRQSWALIDTTVAITTPYL